MQVPFIDLKAQNKLIDNEVNRDIHKVIEQSAFSLTPPIHT